MLNNVFCLYPFRAKIHVAALCLFRTSESITTTYDLKLSYIFKDICLKYATKLLVSKMFRTVKLSLFTMYFKNWLLRRLMRI